MVVTNASVLALMTVEIDRSMKTNLESGSGSVSRSVPYAFTRQKLYMFEQMRAPQFSVVPEFIAVRSPFMAGGSSDSWGFILNNNESKLRKDDLWESSRIVQDAVVTTISGVA